MKLLTKHLQAWKSQSVLLHRHVLPWKYASKKPFFPFSSLENSLKVQSIDLQNRSEMSAENTAGNVT